MSDKRHCFVIMPFSETSGIHTKDYWDNHFCKYLKPLIEETANLEVFRSEALRGNILGQIITDLVTSPLVVADLTDANPNVYWELGVRHSFKPSGTIIIAEEKTKKQFDLSINGILDWHDDHIKDAEFKKSFKKAILNWLDHPEKPDSFVFETITGRGTLFEIFRKDETRRRVEALVSENDNNRFVMEEIYKFIEENKKIKEAEEKYTGRYRMQSFAIQLLVTSRYLDKDNSFYKFFVSWL